MNLTCYIWHKKFETSFSVRPAGYTAAHPIQNSPIDPFVCWSVMSFIFFSQCNYIVTIGCTFHKSEYIALLHVLTILSEQRIIFPSLRATTAFGELTAFNVSGAIIISGYFINHTTTKKSTSSRIPKDDYIPHRIKRPEGCCQ